MYTCPVCQKENATLRCVCGFDISLDYEGYPTLAPLKAGLPSRAASGKNFTDLHRCRGCGGLFFYFNHAKGVCVCAKCSKELAVAPPRPKTIRPDIPKKESVTEKVFTYDAYMKALEQRYVANGRRPLSQSQIDSFLQEHQLDKRFNIRSGDIRKDLEAIYANATSPNTTKQISNFYDYMGVLEALYVQNQYQPLSSEQIQDFLQTHNLRAKFGITEAEVKKDLSTLIQKHEQYYNLANVLVKQSAKDPTALASLLSQLTQKK